MSYFSQYGTTTGVVVEYNGSADGSVTRFDFECRTYLDFGTMAWGTIADIEPSAVRFYIYTREVCFESDWGQLNGGAIFLIGLFWIILVYFGGGTLFNRFFNEKVELPHSTFWGDIYTAFSVAVSFIVTCSLAPMTPYTGLASENADEVEEAPEHSPAEQLPEIPTEAEEA
jgi:hypothetical protein